MGLNLEYFGTEQYLARAGARYLAAHNRRVHFDETYPNAGPFNIIRGFLRGIEVYQASKFTEKLAVNEGWDFSPDLDTTDRYLPTIARGYAEAQRSQAD